MSKPHFSMERQGNALVVTAQAELSHLQADIDQQMLAVLDKLQETGARHLVLDLSQAQFFGTPVLGAMVKVWKKVSQDGGQMALCNVSEDIQKVLHLTKLHTLWPIHSSREEALRSQD